MNEGHLFKFVTLDVKNPPANSVKNVAKSDFKLISNLPIPISIWQKLEGRYYLIYTNTSAKKIFKSNLYWGIKLDEAFPLEYQNIISANPIDDSFYQKIDDDLILICHFLHIKNANENLSIKEEIYEQESFQKIIEPIPVSVIITDIQGNFKYVNKKFIEVTGYTKSEVVGNNPGNLKSINQSEDDYRLMLETILSGEIWNEELINRKKNGEIFYEDAVISAMKDKHGKITNLIAFKEDITKLRTTKDELNRCEKFAALGKIVAFVSHQIKTPLSSIKLSVDILGQDPSICGEAQKSISIIQKEVKHLTGLLNEVLQFSNQSKLYFSQIDLSKNFESIHTFIKPMLKARGIRLNHSTSGHNVYGDAQKLRTLFLHLLENSIESMDIGGIIDISSTIVNDNCHIFIKDTGCGINDEKDIFEPFFTTKSSGSGFGLPIAKNIAERHKGQIKLVSSKPGETIFEIILPARERYNGEASDCR